MSETGVWYCPVCGYVDPTTTDTRCPKTHPSGIGHPFFREIHRGYYVRVGIDEARDAVKPREVSGAQREQQS